MLQAKLKSKINLLPKKHAKVNTSVLCYHGIVETTPKKYNSRFISLKNFNDHLEFFHSQQDIVVVPLENILNNQLIPDKLNLAITFDDGYLNNYKYAIPALLEYGFPATFCVNNPSANPLWTDCLDLVSSHFPNEKIHLNHDYEIGQDKSKLKELLMTSPSSLANDFLASTQELWSRLEIDPTIFDFWKRMDFSQLKEISADSLFSLVPHGGEHLNLTALNIDTLKQEIESSVRCIKQITEEQITSYCPAFGYYNKTVIEALNEINITDVIGVDRNDFNYIHRLVIHPHISFEYLKYFFFKGTFT